MVQSFGSRRFRDVRNLAGKLSAHTISGMSHLGTKTIISKISYVTKPRPGGGFIAHPSDPGMETIEGATEEEVQQKIFAALTTVMGQTGLMSSLLKDLPVDVKPDSSRTMIFKAKFGKDLLLNAGADLRVSNSSSEAPAPIRFEKNRIFLPAILELIALGALLYVILR